MILKVGRQYVWADEALNHGTFVVEKIEGDWAWYVYVDQTYTEREVFSRPLSEFEGFIDPVDQLADLKDLIEEVK